MESQKAAAPAGDVALTLFSSINIYSSCIYTSKQDRPRAQVQVLVCDLFLFINYYQTSWSGLGLGELALSQSKVWRWYMLESLPSPDVTTLVGRREHGGGRDLTVWM